MISITILTKNCARSLEATLLSVADFPEVVILDSGSTDNTLEIAQKFPNVKIFQESLSGFGAMHNRASSLATHDWIFSLDSDEVVSKELKEELFSLQLNTKAAYKLLRSNYFRGKRIRWCGGWHPDWVVRLYNRTSTSFSDDLVHEKVLTEGLTTLSLRHTILHTPYREIGDFLAKMQHYSTLFAEQNRGKIRSSTSKAIAHGAAAFIKSYFFKRGFLGGAEGFIISLYNGQTAFYKYLKLAELTDHE